MGIGMNLSNAIGNSGFANKVSANLETLDNIMLYNIGDITYWDQL